MQVRLLSLVFLTAFSLHAKLGDRLKAKVQQRVITPLKKARNRMEFLHDVRKENLDEIKKDVEAHPDLVNEQAMFGGRTALHIVASEQASYDSNNQPSGREKNLLAIADFLLSKGANPNIVDNRGVTPLFYAAQKGHKEIAKSLLIKGANPNFADRSKVTPLHMSAAQSKPRDVEIAGFLISGNANVNAKDKRGETPLDYAFGSVSLTKSQMTDLLQSNGGKRGSQIS